MNLATWSSGWWGFSRLTSAGWWSFVSLQLPFLAVFFPLYYSTFTSPTSVMGSYDPSQSFEKIPHCGKVSCRAGHTVTCLFGRASLMSPRGTPSWQANLQPASAVKSMRWCYRISIHWKNIFQIPQMGSKVTCDSGCELSVWVSLPFPLSCLPSGGQAPLYESPVATRPWLKDSMKQMYPFWADLSQWGPMRWSWELESQCDLRFFLMDCIQSDRLIPNSNNA